MRNLNNYISLYDVFDSIGFIYKYSEADLVCRQCLEFSDLFGIAILLSVHVSYVASLCVSLYTYGLHW